MRSLDEILSEKAQQQFQTAIVETLDFSQWTVENREEKLNTLRNIASQVAVYTEDFTKQLIETTIANNSILYYKLMLELITSEVEILAGLREELDVVENENIPVDVNWLTEHIRSRYKEIGTLSQVITEKLEGGAAEEL